MYAQLVGTKSMSSVLKSLSM